MKINDRYMIKLCVVEEDANGVPGNIYDSFEEFKREHPFSSYRYGYYVVDLLTGHVPDECNDWNDSPDEAMADYRYNCTEYMNGF